MEELTENPRVPMSAVPGNGTINTPSSPVVPWNTRLEEAAKDIGESAKAYKIMHIEEAQEATTVYNRLMIAGIVAGPLAAAVTSVSTAASVDENTLITCNVASILLGFISGIVVSIIKFGKYDEVSNANKQAAARYTSIESNVRRQLGLYREDRVSASHYMEWLEAKYDELFMSAPLLPSVAYDRLNDRSEALGVRVPNRYDTVIEINHEYEDAKMGEVQDRTDIQINENPGIGAAPEVSAGGEKLRDVVRGVMISQSMKGEKKIKRSGAMSQFPELNECSDQMLQYEMKRMMGFS